MESVVVCIARWALLIISVSCRVVALCGLRLNIARKGNIRSRDEMSQVWHVEEKERGRERARENLARLHSKTGHKM